MLLRAVVDGVVLPIAVVGGVAVLARHAQGRGEDAHRPHELADRDALEHLDVLEDLFPPSAAAVPTRPGRSPGPRSAAHIDRRSRHRQERSLRSESHDVSGGSERTPTHCGCRPPQQNERRGRFLWPPSTLVLSVLSARRFLGLHRLLAQPRTRTRRRPHRPSCPPGCR